jgi:hypothetical protein
VCARQQRHCTAIDLRPHRDEATRALLQVTTDSARSVRARAPTASVRASRGCARVACR